MAATDRFEQYSGSMAAVSDGPYSDAQTVTPHDTNELTYVSRALYIGVVGDVTLVTLKGTTVLFKAVPAGSVIRIRAKQVKATGTTATQILALD